MLLTTFWHEWGPTVEWGAAVVGGWWAKAAANRLQAQRNTIDASQAENERIRLSLDRERSLTERVLAYGTQTQATWKILYQREAVLIEYHAAAIGARLRVHEMEAAQNKPQTQFQPLPGYPPVDTPIKPALTPSSEMMAMPRNQVASARELSQDVPTEEKHD